MMVMVMMNHIKSLVGYDGMQPTFGSSSSRSALRGQRWYNLPENDTHDDDDDYDDALHVCMYVRVNIFITFHVMTCMHACISEIISRE